MQKTAAKRYLVVNNDYKKEDALMKILIVAAGYLPGKKYGGPVTSVYNFAEMFGDIYELFIITRNHDLHETTPYENVHSGWNQVGKAKVNYLSNTEFYGEKFVSLIDEVKPDLIYTSSIMSARMNFPLLKEAAKRKIPVLLAPRGELNDTALQIKSWKKKPYLLFVRISKLLKDVYIQATSEDELQNCYKHLNVSKDRAFLLPNVPAVAKHKESVNKQPGKLKLVFVARILPNKNLKYAIEIVNKLSGDVCFDIFGPIEDEEYWNACKEKISKAPKNIEISYKGVLKPTEVREVYYEYDCLILPTLFENYGQVIAEAIVHDCPVVISKTTTPWDDINDSVGEFACSLDDKSSFVKALEHITKMNAEEYTKLLESLREYAKKKIDMLALQQAYISVFDTIINQ